MGRTAAKANVNTLGVPDLDEGSDDDLNDKDVHFEDRLVSPEAQCQAADISVPENTGTEAKAAFALKDQIRKFSERKLQEKNKEANRSWLLKRKEFHGFVSVVIVANIVYLGAQAQIQVGDEFESFRGGDV